MNEPQSQEMGLTVPVEQPPPAMVSASTGQSPEELRGEAVGSVLREAYGRASELALSPEEITRLKADFPDEAFRTGAGGKADLIYIEHAHLRDRMDEVLGMGQWALVRTRPHWGEEFTTEKGKPAIRLYAQCVLVVRGCYVSESIGEMVYYPNNASQSYGDAAEGACTDALRRCCKNFGVGLQPWKKGFCEGWWERKRRGPQRPAPPPAPTKPAAKPAPAPKAATKAEILPAEATEKTRAWMLIALRETWTDDQLAGWATDAGILFPGEELEKWPLDKVPTSKAALAALIQRIDRAMVGEPPSDPGHPEPEPEDERDAPWWDVIIPVPPAGTKRDEYLKNPDTIRSLYDRMKAGDEAAQRRLWGFTKWEPKGWEKKDGTRVPPSEQDLAAREALDQFVEYEESKKAEGEH